MSHVAWSVKVMSEKIDLKYGNPTAVSFDVLEIWKNLNSRFSWAHELLERNKRQSFWKQNISAKGKIHSLLSSTLMETCSTESIDKERNGTLDTDPKIPITRQFRCLHCHYFSQWMLREYYFALHLFLSMGPVLEVELWHTAPQLH